MRWSRWEVDCLVVHAGEGAEAVAQRLGRSVASVQVMASRLGISLARRWECPRCGKVTYLPLSPKTGACRICTVEETLGKARADNVEARRALAKEQEAVAKAERERQALYSSTSHYRRKMRRLHEP